MVLQDTPDHPHLLASYCQQLLCQHSSSEVGLLQILECAGFPVQQSTWSQMQLTKTHETVMMLVAGYVRPIIKHHQPLITLASYTVMHYRNRITTYLRSIPFHL